MQVMKRIECPATRNIPVFETAGRSGETKGDADDAVLRKRGSEVNDLCQPYHSSKMGVEIIPGLLDSIRKSTSKQREYGNGKKAAAKAKGNP